MGVYAGPDVSENGLVLALDGGSVKSFKGESTTNLISDPLALSGFPSPTSWSGLEGTVTRTNSLPFVDMYNISTTWLRIEKTSSTNGRIAVLGVSGLQTGVDYCCSFYVYSNDTNLTNLNWLSDNSSVSTIQSSTSYTSSDRGTIRRIQTIFRSVSGSQLNVLRINASDPIGTTVFITGLQVEQKSYPTQVVNGTRGTTVATGGGWADLTGRGNHGELVNGVREDSNNGGSLVFDGVNDYLICGQNTDLQLTSDITVESWIYLNSYPSDWVRIIGTGGNSGNRTYGLWYNGPSGRLLWQRTGATDPGIFPSTPALSLNTWNYIAATTSGSTHVLYLNGISIGTATASGPWAWSNENVTIGFAGFHTYHNGRISKTQVYNRALTAQEIQQNFNAARGRYGI